MTREEQMMNAADRYADEVCDESCTGAQVAETINDFCAGWRAADQNPHWIPVEERLPEENEQVIAYNGVYNEIHLCDYHDGVFEDYFGPFNGTITHWMPLPETPRKEDKE